MIILYLQKRPDNEGCVVIKDVTSLKKMSEVMVMVK